MKLHTERQEVERSGVATETTFHIKTTAKAFDILSSGLYTDPIRAVIRELSCNAYDAHVAAGNANQPFEIHVPNRLEPFFGVKDFGTGLSDEDIMTLYSTYFESTKTESNDFIGALGLGSKSPFSYAKAFEVISRFDNVRRIYSVFINENGVPTIAKLGEVPTDEHNGLEVKITVDKDHFWTFQEKLAQTLRWFPVKPTVVGVHKFEWPQLPKETLAGAGWALFEKNFAHDYSRMTAVQGNVAYKVDISKLNLSDADSHLLESCHIVGFFNIGELEVAASREEIRYDARSVTALKQRIKDVRAGILASIEEQVKKVEAEGANRWQVAMLLNTLAQQKFGGRGIFAEFLKPSKLASIKWYLELGCGGRLQLPQLKYHSVIAYSISSHSDPAKAPVRRSYVGSGIDPTKDTCVFFNDLKIGGVAKITCYLRTVAWSKLEPEKTAITIRRSERPNSEEKQPGGVKLAVPVTPITEKEYNDEYKLIVKALGDVEIKLASKDAPFPARSRGAGASQLPIYMFNKVNVRRYGKSTVEWERVDVEDIDFTAPALYFFIRNGSQIIVHDDKGNEKDISWEVSQTKECLEAAIKLINDGQGTNFDLGDSVFAIGALAAKKVKKAQGWTNLFDALKHQLGQYSPAIEYFARANATPDPMGITAVIRELGSRHNRGYRSDFIRRVGKLHKDSEFRTTVEPLIEASEKFEKMNELAELMKKVDLDLGTKTFDNVNSKPFYKESAFDMYPMLDFVSNYGYLNTSQLDLFFGYIKTIDRS